ncbi:LysR family transcriptional regulator [Actinomadura sp. GTD37]|uniref:LysR family transcriptional regulator n=1 Tax=Actinomadura sp. GTD37 TaxID=1778030 RepID=UPI0035C1D869
MELRDIEIFLTLADELHFGRTADKLLVTRARVSQAIRKTEREIGAALFERTSRRVSLTPIGRRLSEDLGAAYRLIQEGVDRAAAAARGLTGTLRIGFVGATGHEISDVIGAFNARHPDCELQIREATAGDPFTPLRGGDVDLQILWLPVEEPDLTVGPVVLTEDLVLAVSPRNPLARHESVSLEVLADATMLGASGTLPAYMEEAVRPAQTPSGRPIPRGPVTHTVQEILANVAADQGVTPVPAHAVKYFARGDIAYIPIHDSPALEWALIWRSSGETSLVRAFAQVARELRAP